MSGSSHPNDEPLAPDEVDAAFANLADSRHLLLAVSGGPDSLALLITVAGWLDRAGRKPCVSVATVDHGLRAESTAEAEAVARISAGFGLAHATLCWHGEKPAHGIQEAARAARYRLLADHAAAIGADCIVTAHHRDDQAETVLMRLAAGSGIAGLAAMRPRVAAAPGLALARPFLAFPKARLVATVTAAGLAAADDPSNRDAAYARGRLRSPVARAAAETLGLTQERLARLAARAARADEALASVAQAEAARLIRPLAKGGGGVEVSAETFNLPEELMLRVLERAIAEAVGAATRPAVPLRLERLEALAVSLRRARAAGSAMRATLAGALVALDVAGRVHIGPEPPRRRGRHALEKPPVSG
ncbi:MULTISPECIES: tRNA lysidine(34) synthetase TilS [unclassified Chelatococcus]|uniref:tRNA lysidine(34) synthetase TilS n=1 Tax=unclassified Chelatococcus TaxID=2638111 RepID=UPI0002D537C6|nr:MULTISPECIES: tRNA lysidine(34) synthetase TilS [unclassified Chelatococcus]